MKSALDMVVKHGLLCLQADEADAMGWNEKASRLRRRAGRFQEMFRRTPIKAILEWRKRAQV
jgi:hypothetical protein